MEKQGDKYSWRCRLFPDFCCMLITFTAWNASKLGQWSLHHVLQQRCQCAWVLNQGVCPLQGRTSHQDTFRHGYSWGILPRPSLHHRGTIINEHSALSSSLFQAEFVHRRSWKTSDSIRKWKSTTRSSKSIQFDSLPSRKTIFHTGTVQTDTANQTITIMTLVSF